MWPDFSGKIRPWRGQIIGSICGPVHLLVWPLILVQCTTPMSYNCVWEDLEFPTRFTMKFLVHFWVLGVVDILTLNKLKVSDFFCMYWKSCRDFWWAIPHRIKMWEIKNTLNVQERTRTYSVSHSKKLRLDMDLFRPLSHMFLYLLVFPEVRKRHISKFESSAEL